MGRTANHEEVRHPAGQLRLCDRDGTHPVVLGKPVRDGAGHTFGVAELPIIAYAGVIATARLQPTASELHHLLEPARALRLDDVVDHRYCYPLRCAPKNATIRRCASAVASASYRVCEILDSSLKIHGVSLRLWLFMKP